MGSVEKYNKHFLKGSSPESHEYDERHVPIRVRVYTSTFKDFRRAMVGVFEGRSEVTQLHFVKEYAMTDVDASDKYSYDYYNCCGVVMSGWSRSQKKFISFMTHHNPESLLKNDTVYASFTKKLDERMQVVIDGCDPDSVDICMFGGNFFTDISSRQTYAEVYEQFNEQLKTHITERTTLVPDFLTGPNLRFNPSSFAFMNDTRVLHAFREDQPDSVVNDPHPGSRLADRVRRYLKGSFRDRY